MKKVFLLVLLATFAIAAYGQTDSTKVKKKVNYIYVYGTVMDSFTKAGIPDVKAAVLRQDSTLVDTISVYETTAIAAVSEGQLALRAITSRWTASRQNISSVSHTLTTRRLTLITK